MMISQKRYRRFSPRQVPDYAASSGDLGFAGVAGVAVSVGVDSVVSGTVGSAALPLCVLVADTPNSTSPRWLILAGVIVVGVIVSVAGRVMPSGGAIRSHAFVGVIG